MAKLFNRARVGSITAGKGSFTLGPAVTGHQTFAQAGVADGDELRCVAETDDRTEWEIFETVYSSTGPTLTRGTVLDSSNGGSSVNFSSPPQVWVDAAKESIPHEGTYGALVESGSGTGRSEYLIRYDDEGNHTTNSSDALTVVARPQGSGVNGPSAADYGIVVSLIKKDWSDQSLADAGEIDGLKINVRQGGPTGGGSDAAGILVNIANLDDSGFIAVLEATTQNVADGPGFAAQYTAQTQIGTYNDAGGPITAYGFVHQTSVGTTDDGVRIETTEPAATVTYPFHYLIDGTSTFRINSNGLLSWSADDITFGRSAANVATLAGATNVIFSGANLGVSTTGNPSGRIHAYRNDTNTSIPDLLLEQDGTGDASLQFLLTATRAWCFGVDNSDSDKLKISPAADAFASAVFELDTSGNLALDGSATVLDEAYDATGWDGDLTVPTKNAVRDKIETLQPLDATLTDLAGQTIVQGDLLYGDASDSFAVLNKDTNASRYLSNTGTSNNPAWAQVDLTNGVTGDLPFSNLAQGSALSVLGVTGNSTADNASISAGADHNILRRNGTAVAFGSIDLSQSGAVGSSVLAGVNGGTGLSTAAVGDLIYASATTPTWSRLAGVAAGQVLVSGGINTAPAWSATPLVTSVDIGNADTTISRSAAGILAVEGIDLARTVDIQEFTSSDTWTKPTGAKYVEILLVGGGGGGGGGARTTSGNASSGGGGGGGGARLLTTVSAADLAGTATITIGAAGSSGAGATVDGTAGSDGGVGGDTSFSAVSVLAARGGGGGAGGEPAANSGGGGGAGLVSAGGNATGTTGGAAGTLGGIAGGSGAAASNNGSERGGGGGSGGVNGAAGSGGTATSATAGGGTGGGGGGGISAAPAAFDGGASAFASFAYGRATSAAGGTLTGPGGAGASGVGKAGSGGGGGASNTAGVGGAGGAGGNYGGGGGGGGSAIGGNGGAGGAGAPGYARVVTYF